MKHGTSCVISNEKIAFNLYELTCTWELEPPVPGEFFTIRISPYFGPLLRRPFAFSAYYKEAGSIQILYEKRGNTTSIMTGLTAGDVLDVLGPLGHGFPEHTPSKTPVLLAGGTGIGPIFFLYTYMIFNGIHPYLLIGAKHKEELPLTLIGGRDRNVVCTEDGSQGFKGTVTDGLLSMKEDLLVNSVLYCCGPTPMLKACAEIAEQYTLPCYVSLEQTMACGVGACMGCAIRVKGPEKYARVCKEGPVFEAGKIVWI